MTETLTESFCERCGTRYEFSAPSRLNPLRKTRGLIGGLKNYLTSQDDLSDAINDAMRDEEGALATAQLSAFHESFNFCIDCRQYTCLNCWNDGAGRCRTCVPIPGQDDLAERIAAAAVGQPMVGFAEATDAELGQHVGMEAWPTHDLPPDALPATNGHAEDDSWATTPGTWAATPPPAATSEAVPAPGGGFVGVDGFVYETQEQADAVAAQLQRQRDAEAQALAAAAEAEAEAEALAAAAQLDVEAAALTEPEPAVAEAAPETTPEPVIAEALPETEPVAAEAAPETTPEPVIAEALPETEPVAAEALPEPGLRVVAWDDDVTYELEPEPVSAEAEVAAVAEIEPPVGTTAPLWPEVPVEAPAAAEAAPEPVAAEAEPVAAEAEPEPAPEPIAAASETEPEPAMPVVPPIAPISETILRFPERPAAAAEPQPLAAQDDSPEAAARRAQLDDLGLGDPGQGPLQSDRQVLPYRSRGAAMSQAELALRAAAGQRFWEASAREVASAVGNVGVQNCGECGLSLSANARFCRRCGTRQAQSA